MHMRMHLQALTHACPHSDRRTQTGTQVRRGTHARAPHTPPQPDSCSRRSHITDLPRPPPDCAPRHPPPPPAAPPAPSRPAAPTAALAAPGTAAGAAHRSPSDKRREGGRGGRGTQREGGEKGPVIHVCPSNCAAVEKEMPVREPCGRIPAGTSTAVRPTAARFLACDNTALDSGGTSRSHKPAGLRYHGLHRGHSGRHTARTRVLAACAPHRTAPTQVTCCVASPRRGRQNVRRSVA